MFTQFCGIVPRQKITHTGKGETLLMGKSNITERNFAVTMEAAADITPFSNREVKSSAFTQPYPLEKTLRLSDSYIEKPDSLMLELVAKVININLPENHAILRKCRPLYEYSWFIQRIREYMRRGQERDTAVIQAVKDCEKEGILAEFVRKYGSEVVNMLFTQFNMDDALEVRYEEGREDGIEQGRKEGKEEGRVEGKEEGEFLKLIKLICLKLKKEKTVKAIAEELEEEESKISQICAVAKECNLDVDRIYSEFQAVLGKDDGKAITGH